MRSLHSYTPVSGSFTSEPLDQSVNGTSIRSLKKKRKVVACVTIYKQTIFHVNKKNAGKPRLRSIAALAATFSVVAFYCYL